jgi:hypothetical protein
MASKITTGDLQPKPEEVDLSVFCQTNAQFNEVVV